MHEFKPFQKVLSYSICLFILIHTFILLLAIGVIRMVKLFGWEDKMSEKVAEERREELGWIWKVKVKLASVFLRRGDIQR